MSTTYTWCIRGLCLLAMAGGAFAQGDLTKVIPVTIRDFNASHPDFESPQCYGGKRMVQTVLDADHKPTHLPGGSCPDNQLREWFRDSPASKRYCQDLTLTKKAGTENTFEFEDRTYFPIDNVPSRETSIPGEDGQLHNFHFCMEMHAAFKYRGGEVFNFNGDDDVWVYINNNLALDLGGVHTPQAGVVDLDAQKDILKITPGNYYNFDFFFCERQTIGSNLIMNTSIDIIPPPPPGYHIADAALDPIPAGDTLVLTAAQSLHAVEIKTQEQTVDCSNVVSQVRNPVSANWTFAGNPMPAGTSVRLDPNAYPDGLHRLIMEKNGLKDTVWIRIQPLPVVAKPVATPPGGEFVVSVQVSLASATPAAVIHYTLDGSEPTSASPVYTAPLRITADTRLKAIAVKTGHIPSGVMEEVYTRRLAEALKGWYQDRDGDGRIETAVLVFDEAFIQVPGSLRLDDPFLASRVETAPVITAGPRSLTATFPPFAPGTGFPAAPLAHIPAEPGLYPAKDVVMEDSVGPVLIAARSFPALPGNSAQLEVDFSEAVDLAAGTPRFPFELKRGVALVAPAGIQVSTIAPLTATRYRFTFLPESNYPVPGDSLRINPGSPGGPAPGLADSRGNPSNMQYFIPVAGDPLREQGKIEMVLERGVSESVPVRAAPGARPFLVHGGGACLNCDHPALSPLLPPGALANPGAVGPTWKVSTRFPFRYSMVIFDNLGQYVARAEGTVTADQLAKIPKQAGGDSTQVRLTYLPVSEAGNALATGAYILKGTASILDQAAHRGRQGEAVLVVPGASSVVSRFGYMRR